MLWLLQVRGPKSIVPIYLPSCLGSTVSASTAYQTLPRSTSATEDGGGSFPAPSERV